MRNLVLSTLLLAGLTQAGTGCIISGDDDDGGSAGCPGGAGIEVDISYVCPSNADSIEIDATPTDSTQSITDTGIPCSDQFVVECYDAGSYDLVVTPTGGGDFAGAYAPVDGVDGDTIEVDLTDAFPDDAAYFVMDWTVNGADPAGECSNVGATTVAIDATGTGGAVGSEFACEDGFGVSDAFPLDDYTVSVSIDDDTGAALATADPITTSLDYGDQASDLGTFDFQL